MLICVICGKGEEAGFIVEEEDYYNVHETCSVPCEDGDPEGCRHMECIDRYQVNQLKGEE